MLTESFLSEFPPVATEQWEEVIRERITGHHYASKLLWHPEEGLAVRPYYRAPDLVGLPYLGAAPGEFPFIRGMRATGGWRIREEFDIADPEAANHTAFAAVAAGAEEISFRSPNLASASHLVLLLENLHKIPVHFECLQHAATELLIERLKAHPHGTSVSIDLDPLGDVDFSADMIHNSPHDFRPFVIHADQYHECAAGAIEEVGFALSAAVDFVAEMQARGLDVRHISASLSFCFAMGPDFFLQIAKLRAFRMLWARAIESLGGTQADGRAVIHARTAHWNETIYSPHVNILRATTEVISAILGGADSISCSPFDQCFCQSNESSRRLARNTQIVLKQEALLSRVADPVGGSYVIEVLTDSIAAKAWKLFQEIETAEGYRRAMASGVIPSVLERRTSSRDQAVENRQRVLTGTNRFADASESIFDGIDALRINSTPRAARAFESLRLRTEQFLRQGGEHANILLAEIGEARISRARSQFAADFLACAGLTAAIQRFESPAEIAACDADLIVLCSSDTEYLSIAAALMPLLEDLRIKDRIVIAGNPDTADQLRSIGVIEFMHVHSNAPGVLRHIQGIIGIEE